MDAPMSLLRRDTPPPTESWEGLREWARQPWWHRFRESLLLMLPFTTVLLLVSGVGLLFAEPSWRSVRLIAILWVVCVPLAGLGHMRRLSRAAAQVPPISAASLNATTAVDIRGNRSD
jgi:hypothetical protein